MVSFGFANWGFVGCGGGPEVYVNVPHYRKWIDDRINNGGRLTTFDKSFHNALLSALILIGMMGETFISLSSFDQIVSAEFSSKNFKKFGGEN